MDWVRWTVTILFLLALFSIAVAATFGALVMSRVAVLLKRAEAGRQTSDQLTRLLLGEIVKRPVFPIGEDKPDPPITMGMDFGVAQLLARLMGRTDS